MHSHIRPLSCSPKLVSLIVSLFLTAVLNLLGCSIADRAAPIDINYGVVERVIDGDTLVMRNGERVRLIGVDKPEIKHPTKPVEHFGKEAAAFSRRMVEGSDVRLEFDPANAPRAHKDSTQQRRTLAYVFLEDGTLFNAEIIKQGKASLTRVFHLDGWRSLDGYSGRRGSKRVGCGHRSNSPDASIQKTFWTTYIEQR